MIFYTFFKTLVGKEIAVEMKNDVVLTGTLVSVDQYLNIKLSTVNVVNSEKYPQVNIITSMIRIFIQKYWIIIFQYYFSFNVNSSPLLKTASSEGP